MRLLFNATNIRSEGGVILMRHLLEGFLSEKPDLQILLYLNPELGERLKDLSSERLEIVPFRPRGSFGRFWWEQVSLPNLIRKQRIDTLFSFGNTGPRFPGCRQILYLQQSIPYTDYRPDRHRLRWQIFQRLYGFLIGLAQRGSERIVVPTGWLVEPMRRSIGSAKPVSAYRVSLPGPPDLNGLLDENRLLSANEMALLDRIEHWRASDEKILLYPCYLAPYKNIPFLLEALALASKKTDKAFRLLLTVDRESREYFPCRDEVFAALGQHADLPVELCGSLSRAAMAEVYKRSDVLVFPSLVETLGLPLLEAMSFAVPVLALRNDSPTAKQAAFAEEICRDAALYAMPDQPAALAEVLVRLLEDPVLTFDLGQRGQERANSLSWQSHIREILS